MIQFLSKRNAAWVRITADTAVRGNHVKKGELIQVDAECADALLGSERCELLETPPTPEQVEDARAAAHGEKRTKKKE